ncbi:MAG TPA: AmmeMemoRadiSam system radical SAM enzyme [Phaeodactylibacter sp.]|nr:AmmeMemoRadiSam system radical SAM enzyme [Phaeodactylibacter sp.]
MLKNDKKIANYWKFLPSEKKVECHLCPRNCKLKNGQDGFCRVRGNTDDVFYTYNFGKSIEATVETIETEAVYHFRPGARILSLGNIGCMMACSFCQNWQTSQVKHLDIKNVKKYTPQEVVDMALSNHIDIISWTYNDPVVWQEFVVETSKLAQANGIKTLYKSALYITAEPLAELIECIDIFSISLKSMNAEVYRKVTKGRLQPVLDAIQQIAKSDRHLEISQLIVTGLNDNEEDATKTARWIVKNLGQEIPLHFVAYHPAFRYTQPRTSTEKLLTARNLALKEGIKYCYLGNIYHDNVSNTICENCGNMLVQRFGLTVHNRGLDDNNNCKKCGCKSPIVGKVEDEPKKNKTTSDKIIHFDWDDEIKSIHIVLDKGDAMARQLIITRIPSKNATQYEMNQGVDRLIISKSQTDETGIQIGLDNETEIQILPVLDRAHFPVIN